MAVQGRWSPWRRRIWTRRTGHPTPRWASTTPRDWTSALAALESFHAPQQNITYADVDGNIGFVAPGRVPVRRSGRGWMPAPGWTGEADWIGHIPFDQLPRVLNPPSGVLVNANNRITPKDYPHFITDDWARPYRAQRIRDVIGAEAPHGPDDAQRLQMDAVSLMARDLMALPRRGAIRPAPAASGPCKWYASGMAPWPATGRNPCCSPPGCGS